MTQPLLHQIIPIIYCDETGDLRALMAGMVLTFPLFHIEKSPCSFISEFKNVAVSTQLTSTFIMLNLKLHDFQVHVHLHALPAT